LPIPGVPGDDRATEEQVPEVRRRTIAPGPGGDPGSFAVSAVWISAWEDRKTYGVRFRDYFRMTARITITMIKDTAINRIRRKSRLIYV
jgi:hypothetical protein